MPIFYGKLALSSPEQKEALKSQDPMSINAALQAQEGTAQELIASSKAEQPPPNAYQMFGKKLDTNNAIVLENVASGFVKPNILDVKLGARLWDDDAPLAKRQRLDEVSGKTTSGSLGFRIAGMRVWQPENSSDPDDPNGEFKVYDKSYGRGFTDESVRSGFEDFFLEGTSGKRKLSALRRAVVELCEAEVTQMVQVLEGLESRMYSASILFVYEGDNKSLDKAITAIEELQKGDGNKPRDNSVEDDDADSDDEYNTPKIHAAKIIDFAHARWTPGQGPDENMLRGVRSVRKILRQLLDA